MRKHLQKQAPRVKEIVRQISAGDNWHPLWIAGQHAEAAKRGLIFNGRVDDVVTPAGVIASLGSDRCLTLYTSMVDVARNGRDPYSLDRHRQALTAEVVKLGRVASRR